MVDRRLGVAAAVLALLLLSQCGDEKSIVCGSEELGDVGTVFYDDNANGVQDPDEPRVANAIVFFEDKHFCRANRDGTFFMRLPEEGGMLWVRGQDGLDPGPFWIDVPGGGLQPT